MLSGTPQICGRFFEYLCPDHHSVAVHTQIRSIGLLACTVMKISCVQGTQLNRPPLPPIYLKTVTEPIFQKSCFYSILCIAPRFGERFGRHFQAHFFQNMTAHDDPLHHGCPNSLTNGHTRYCDLVLGPQVKK
jgi:hypothetical protein